MKRVKAEWRRVGLGRWVGLSLTASHGVTLTCVLKGGDMTANCLLVYRLTLWKSRAQPTQTTPALLAPNHQHPDNKSNSHQTTPLTRQLPPSSSWLSMGSPRSRRSCPCWGHCSRGWNWIRKCSLCCLFSFCWGVRPSSPSTAARPRCPAAAGPQHSGCLGQGLGCCSCNCFPVV